MRITQDNPKFTFIFVIPIPKALTRPSSCLERQIAMAENKKYCHGTQVRTVTKNAYLAAERHIKCRAALPQSLLLRP